MLTKTITLCLVVISAWLLWQSSSDKREVSRLSAALYDVRQEYQRLADKNRTLQVDLATNNMQLDACTLLSNDERLKREAAELTAESAARDARVYKANLDAVHAQLKADSARVAEIELAAKLAAQAIK